MPWKLNEVGKRGGREGWREGSGRGRSGEGKGGEGKGLWRREKVKEEGEGWRGEEKEEEKGWRGEEKAKREEGTGNERRVIRK